MTAEEVPAGQVLAVPLGAGDPAPVSVRWQGGPAVATWRLAGEPDAAGAACASTTAETWHLVGFDTRLGSFARLHLFNPFSSDAAVRLRFGTPTGAVALVIADNLAVPARSFRVVELGEFQPEIADLAVTVEVLGGRVVPMGEQVLGRGDPETPAPEGRAFLAAVSQPSDDRAAAARRGRARAPTRGWRSTTRASSRPRSRCRPPTRPRAPWSARSPCRRAACAASRWPGSPPSPRSR